MENIPSRHSKASAEWIRLAAFTGARQNEANNILWPDIDFERGTVALRETKNRQPRWVPMIKELRAMLLRMRSERAGDADSQKVLRVSECQKSMDAAAKTVGMERITHHHLRHLFATVLIESGNDIPTVARIMGHKDGGALAMRVYGHLRDEHAQAAMQKVSFAP